jgi:hypothetical protein
MSTPYRRAILALILFAALAASFAVGRWSGTLKGSLEREASYPWALHKKISNIDTRCERLRTPPTIGKFFIQPTDDGETLLIAVLDDRSGTVNAFAINSLGQVASDSWPVECK